MGRPFGTASALEMRRRQAVLAVQNGDSVTDFARIFGVSMHHDHIGRFVRERLKWTPQKPRRRATERDEAAIEHWKKQEFPRIVKDAAERCAHIVFLDESGFMFNPTVRRTWAPIGCT